MSDAQSSAVAIYVVMARDACDAMDMITECSDRSALDLLLAMLEASGSARADKSLNELFVPFVKRRIEKLAQ